MKNKILVLILIIILIYIGFVVTGPHVFTTSSVVPV